MIGGSLALALRKRRPDWKLKLWARSPASVQRTRELFPDTTSEIAAAVEGADLCVLCTPISAMADLAENIAPHLSPAAAVTDAGRVKCGVVQRLEHILGGRFVGSHPMAGSEKSGLEAARADLFEGAVSILTPTPRSLLPALWRKIFLENKEELLTGLEDFSTMIDDLKKLIRSEDAVALEAFLARARATRERLP